MTFTKQDLRRLRGSLSGLLLALCAGGAAIATSEIMLARSQRLLSDLQQQMNSARRQLSSTEEDNTNMQTYQREYGDLLTRNIIGSDQRLDWVEGMEAIRKQNIVLGFRYVLAASQPSQPPSNSKPAAEFSSMDLHFDLLHEGQLLDFFDAMHNKIRGRYLIRRCTMKRNATPPASTGIPDLPVQLEAECSGDWLILQQRGDK